MAYAAENKWHADKVLRDRVRNEDIRERCKKQDVVYFIIETRKPWNNLVGRMTEKKCAKQKKTRNTYRK